MWLCWSRNHIIIEYPEREDPQGLSKPSSWPYKEKPKNHTECLTALSQHALNCQVWCCGHFAGESVPVPNTFWVKYIFLISSLNIPWHNLMLFLQVQHPTLKATLSSGFMDRNGRKRFYYSPASLLSPPTTSNSKLSKERDLALWGRLLHTSLRLDRQPSQTALQPLATSSVI